MLTLILGTTIKYFQMCLNIEKQYEYIHKLEAKINTIANEKLITREGFSYLQEYPLLSALIHRMYTLFLPIGLILSMLSKFYTICKNGINLIDSLNIIIVFLIMFCTFLYLLFTYREVRFVKITNVYVKKLFVLIHLYKEDTENE